MSWEATPQVMPGFLLRLPSLFPGHLFFWDFPSEEEVEAFGYQPLVKEGLEGVTEAE